MSNTRIVSLREVVNLMNNGYVRWKADERVEGKSIQTYYNLSFSDAKELFSNPKLVNRKTRFTSRLEIIDDLEEVGYDANPAPTTEAVSAPQTAVEVVEDNLFDN